MKLGDISLMQRLQLYDHEPKLLLYAENIQNRNVLWPLLISVTNDNQFQYVLDLK